MAITSWTSESMDWADVHLAPHYPDLEAARLALIERAGYLGQNAPAALVEIVRFAPLSPDWFDAFQTLLSTIIPYYVKHVDLDNFESFPYWDETTILAAIGDAERIPAAANRPNDISAAWLQQQYKIINMLRVLTPITGYLNFSGIAAKNESTNAIYNSAAEAEAAIVAKLNAASWGGSSLNFAYTVVWQDGDTGKYAAIGFLGKQRLEFNNEFNVETDCLLFTMGGDIPDTSGFLYGNGGDVLPYNGAWHYYKSVTLAANATATEDVYYSDASSLQFHPTQSGEDWIVYGCEFEAAMLAYRPKFNFRNW